MSDYRLETLNTRSFQQMVQSLCQAIISQGMKPTNDGPDGGRDAFFEGPTNYPAGEPNERWNGKVVMQCKFRQTPYRDKRDADWFITAFKKEFAEYSKPGSLRQKPDYYLAVTNVSLSDVPQSGGKDRALAAIRESAADLGLKGVDIWSYAEICRYLSQFESIRNAYDLYLSAGEYHAALLRRLKKTEFRQIIPTMLAKQLLREKKAKLSSGGDATGLAPWLSKVFVDLPALIRGGENSHYTSHEFKLVSHLIKEGNHDLRHGESLIADRDPHSRSSGCYLLIGGPGHGKSTVGQFLCQLHRAMLLKTAKTNLPQDALEIQNDILRKDDFSEDLRLNRFPCRLDLSFIAEKLTKDDSTNIVEILRTEIETIANFKCESEDIREWLSDFPWLFVLDGLDEVPVSSNRQRVIQAINDLRTELAVIRCDAMILVTTRPHGYNQDLDQSVFQQIELRPLNRPTAMAYAKQFCKATYEHDIDRSNRLLTKLEDASTAVATAKFFSTPLQITILAEVLDQTNTTPRYRYDLFEQYYSTIYKRECGHGRPFAAFLQFHRTLVNEIHQRIGLILHFRSERDSKTGGELTYGEFSDFVKSLLIQKSDNENTASDLFQHLERAIFERLVLLVGMRERHLAFEHRQFQEFMAAAAITSSLQDREIAQVIKGLAPLSHWREVLLLCVSRFCSGQREYLMDSVLEACRLHNRVSRDRLLSVVRARLAWGGRLAQDILMEGITDGSSDIGDALLELTERLVEQSDPKLQLSYLSAIETQKFWKNFSVIERVNSTKNPVGFGTLLAAMAVRVIRGDKNYESFFYKSLENMSPTVALSLAIAIRQIDRDAVNTIAKYLDDVLHTISPEELRRNEQSLPMPAEGAFRAFLQLASGEIQRKNLVAVVRGADCKNQIGISLLGLAIEQAREFGQILVGGKTISNSEWQPYVSSYVFACEPTAEALAIELERLAALSSLPKVPVRELAWPLASVYECAESPNDLIKLATDVRIGKFGNKDSWLQAEDRVFKKGVTVEDWRSSAISDRVLSSDIVFEGVPFTGLVAYYDTLFTPEEADARYELLKDSFDKSAGSANYANNAINAIFALGCGKLSRKISCAEFVRLLKVATTDNNFEANTPAVIFENLDWTNLDPAWRQPLRDYAAYYNHRFYSSVSLKDWSNVQEAANAFARNPDEWIGLLPLLTAAAIEGVYFQLNDDPVRPHAKIANLEEPGGLSRHAQQAAIVWLHVGSLDRDDDAGQAVAVVRAMSREYLLKAIEVAGRRTSVAGIQRFFCSFCTIMKQELQTDFQLGLEIYPVLCRLADQPDVQELTALTRLMNFRR